MPRSTEAIKVLVVDDHPVVRLGLRTMLESEGNITVTGTAASAKEALAEVQRQRPDVVLMDLRMPEMEGAEAILELRRMDPNIRILVLTNYEEDEYIFRALQAGAMGYLLKSTPQEEIVEAVEMVHANKRCIPQNIAKRLMDTIARWCPTCSTWRRRDARQTAPRKSAVHRRSAPRSRSGHRTPAPSVRRRSRARTRGPGRRTRTPPAATRRRRSRGPPRHRR